MRHSYLMILLCVMCSAAFAQEKKPEKLTNIVAPTSPAAVIIGAQPATISKPRSWEALETGVYQNYFNQNGGFSIPNDYALEFAPYWLQTNPTIPFNDFVRPSVMKSLAQNFSMSIASTKSFILNDTTKSDALGIGIRTMLWQPSKKELNKLKALSSRIVSATDLNVLVSAAAVRLTLTTKEKFINDLITNLKSNTAPIKAALGITDNSKYQEWLIGLKKLLNEGLSEDNTRFFDELDDITTKSTKLVESASELEEMIKNRSGFKLEAAGSIALNFPTNQTNVSYVSRAAVWLTPSYKSFENNNWEILGVLRYNWLNNYFYEKFAVTTELLDNNVDLGARLVYNWNKFSIEGEAVWKFSKVIISQETDDNGVTTTLSKSRNDFQYILNLNYRVTDSMIISYSFGKQFRPQAYIDQTLVNALVLNFGIGGPRKESE